MTEMGHLRPSSRSYAALHVRFAPKADKYDIGKRPQNVRVIA
jgi:hypothetical protein